MQQQWGKEERRKKGKEGKEKGKILIKGQRDFSFVKTRKNRDENNMK